MTKIKLSKKCSSSLNILESGTKSLHFLIIKEVSIKGGTLAFITLKLKIKATSKVYFKRSLVLKTFSWHVFSEKFLVVFLVVLVY